MRTLCATVAIALLAAAPILAEDDARGPYIDPNYVPKPPKEGFSYPDCYCTDSDGQRVELGQTTCLSIGSRQVTARCETSLNNPTWRTMQEGCPGV